VARDVEQAGPLQQVVPADAREQHHQQLSEVAKDRPKPPPRRVGQLLVGPQPLGGQKSEADDDDEHKHRASPAQAGTPPAHISRRSVTHPSEYVPRSSTRYTAVGGGDDEDVAVPVRAFAVETLVWATSSLCEEAMSSTTVARRLGPAASDRGCNLPVLWTAAMEVRL
jgi:hypothetical protein